MSYSLKSAIARTQRLQCVTKVAKRELFCECLPGADIGIALLLAEHSRHVAPGGLVADIQLCSELCAHPAGSSSGAARYALQIEILFGTGDNTGEDRSSANERPSQFFCVVCRQEMI